jgi:formylglycine-generating enzyme required for sulfatase activity
MTFPAMANDFRLDKYEVTVGRFRMFVDAGKGTQSSPPSRGAGTHANIAASGWDERWNRDLAANKDSLIAALKCDGSYQTWTDDPGANEDRPINCVSWYEAMAFCAWDDGYLPTESEWNYASSGGNAQRAYPWSIPPESLAASGSRASYFDGGCIGDGMPGCALSDLIMVGTKAEGDGRWGHADLAGNVGEWTLDWLAPYASPCNDCANLTTATARVVRGGHFQSQVFSLRVGSRDSRVPMAREAHVGVRCARGAI